MKRIWFTSPIFLLALSLSSPSLASYGGDRDNGPGGAPRGPAFILHSDGTYGPQGAHAPIWVFHAANRDVPIQMTVTDTSTGETKVMGVTPVDQWRENSKQRHENAGFPLPECKPTDFSAFNNCP